MATTIQLKKQKEFLNKNGRKKLNRLTVEQLAVKLGEATHVKHQRKIARRIRDLKKRANLVIL